MSNANEAPGGVSSEAVTRATGRNWNEWIEFLDGLGAFEMTHKEIVALLSGPGGLDNGWWQQSVAVGYEQAKGMRVVGQTSGADFQIGVQKTLPVPPDAAWKLLCESPGRDAWLGECPSFCESGLESSKGEFSKGQRYSTADGVSGEIRSVAPGVRVRLTWNSPQLSQPSTLQVTLVAAGNRTSFRFHQERLSNLEEREAMRGHWRRVLEDLGQVALRSDFAIQDL